MSKSMFNIKNRGLLSFSSISEFVGAKKQTNCFGTVVSSNIFEDFIDDDD